MGNQTAIAWTNKTWNPWQGCIKVSPGCKFCYMYRDKERYKQDPKNIHRSARNTFRAPLSWTEPGLVFTCSWSDWFIKEADEWRAEAWEIIRRTPHLIYQILTKRPERIEECLPPGWMKPGLDGTLQFSNVWLGVSVENQDLAEQRLPILAKVTAAVRFVSFEPLLGAIKLSSIPVMTSGAAEVKKWTPAFEWAIIGGESGNETGRYRFRECQTDWIASLIHECESAGVPVFVKQVGSHIAKVYHYQDRHGKNLAEWPKRLQVQQWPVIHSLKIPFTVKDVENAIY